MSSRAPVRRTETAVVVVVGRVQAAAALLMHRAPGCRGRYARCQQGGHAHVDDAPQHGPFAFRPRQGENKDRSICALVATQIWVVRYSLEALYLKSQSSAICLPLGICFTLFGVVFVTPPSGPLSPIEATESTARNESTGRNRRDDARIEQLQDAGLEHQR